jgi:hypothetical protein
LEEKGGGGGDARTPMLHSGRCPGGRSAQAKNAGE